VTQKQVLGKGLASLFPGVGSIQQPSTGLPPAGAIAAGPATIAMSPSVTSAEVQNKDRQMGIALAFLDDIQVNQYQPRREFDPSAIEELAQSIRENGIIQPLVVRKTSIGSYELIAGERRLRAAKKAGLKQVPIVVRRSTDREALELALIENIQRENLNCIDTALAYFQLIQDFSLTQEEVAVKVGKDRASIANHLRLLRLPEAIIDDLKKGVLTFGHGKALLGLEDNELRMRARLDIIDHHMSVREAEALVEKMKTSVATGLAAVPSVQNSSTAISPVKARLANLAQDLTRLWSARVELKGSERRGKITFHYSSRQELDRLLEAMQNKHV